MWIRLKGLIWINWARFGKIYIDDENGSITLDGFMVEFFTEVNDPFMGVSYREYAMVADFKSENGEYHAKLLQGEYQVEAWGWGYDDKIDQPINFRPQIALEANGNPKTYLVVNEKDKYSKVDFILQEEYTLSWDQGQVTAQLLNIETGLACRCLGCISGSYTCGSQKYRSGIDGLPYVVGTYRLQWFD